MKKVMGIVAVAAIAVIGGTASAKDLDSTSSSTVIGQSIEGQFSSSVAVGLSDTAVKNSITGVGRTAVKNSITGVGRTAVKNSITGVGRTAVKNGR